MIPAATRPTRLGRRQEGRSFVSMRAVAVILGHGSGLDELTIFVFPAVVGIGFWLLITRHKPDEDEDEEDDDMTERD
jgi:hypothetical protein